MLAWVFKFCSHFAVPVILFPHTLRWVLCSNNLQNRVASTKAIVPSFNLKPPTCSVTCFVYVYVSVSSAKKWIRIFWVAHLFRDMSKWRLRCFTFIYLHLLVCRAPTGCIWNKEVLICAKLYYYFPDCLPWACLLDRSVAHYNDTRKELQYSALKNGTHLLILIL